HDDLLYALAHARAMDLPHHLDRALGEPDAAWAALEIIAGDPAWCPRVYGLFSTSAYAPYGGLEEKAALYLGRHHHRLPEVMAYLVAQGWPLWDVLIVLALEDAPHRLGEFVTQGLWSRRSEDRLTAAVLALRDDEWSRRLLLSVLSESHSLDRTM